MPITVFIENAIIGLVFCSAYSKGLLPYSWVCSIGKYFESFLHVYFFSYKRIFTPFKGLLYRRLFFTLFDISLPYKGILTPFKDLLYRWLFLVFLIFSPHTNGFLPHVAIKILQT